MHVRSVQKKKSSFLLIKYADLRLFFSFLWQLRELQKAGDNEIYARKVVSCKTNLERDIKISQKFCKKKKKHRKQRRTFVKLFFTRHYCWFDGVIAWFRFG